LPELLGRTVEEGKFVATVSLEERDFECMTMPTLIKEEVPGVEPVFAVAIQELRGKGISYFW